MEQPFAPWITSWLDAPKHWGKADTRYLQKLPNGQTCRGLKANKHQASALEVVTFQWERIKLLARQQLPRSRFSWLWLKANFIFAAPLRWDVQAKGRNTCDHEIPAEKCRRVPNNANALTTLPPRNTNKRKNLQHYIFKWLLQFLLVAKHLWCLFHLCQAPLFLCTSLKIVYPK